MGKKVENVLIRLIGYDWDEPSELNEAMQRLIKGIDPKKVKVEIVRKKGYHSDNIYVLEIKSDKDKIIREILRNLLGRVENWEEFKEYTKGRWEGNTLYLRFDKDYFLRLDKLVPTEGGEVVYVKISFPGYIKKEQVERELDQFREEGLNKLAKEKDE